MKNIKNIFAWILIILLNINIVLASWIPDEPMVIYGNIEWITDWTLNVYDWDNNLIQTTNFSNNTYGTNKTFDIDNKIIINNFEWNLDFDISWYTQKSITKWETNYCNSTPIFQAGNICQYNLVFEKIVTSSWGWWWGGWSSSYSTTNTDTEDEDESDEDEDESDEDEDEEEDEEEVKKEIIFNNDKKVIKNYSDIKIESRDYAIGLRTFVKNKKEIKDIWWLKVVNIKWDTKYNLVIEWLVKKVNKEITLLWIKKDVVKVIDKMSMSYWISIDEEIDENIREKFRQKYILDVQNIEKRLKAAKMKDYIINKTFEKRRLEKTQKKVEVKKIEVKKEELIKNDVTYSIAVWSIKLNKNKDFTESNWILYFWEKVEQISRTQYVVKVKVLESKDWYTWNIWYISRKYLRELK